ncbi:hypothetical protein FB565_007089 [Actinoplanes lutulentus]|uniref:Glycoside hydrolase family 127 protein n=1 Tax=Actinoplanes lutulentus TaxID=1287878 RepID=A0A327ZCZ0_9ACTN|nr:beta-L-arabinofuranosidase domain-containing protein [Actinoplanes lutulentus]MBB2947321.1 hypothetical protein [Actinoplanes lutulentus]RAK36596.1 hypothetical protein B0I29_108186 [Actinoplanes lutulentus]
MSYGAAVPSSGAVTVLQPLPRDGIALRPDGLLASWQRRNATTTLPHNVEQLETHGNVDNLRRVTGDVTGAFTGFWFGDTDVHKTLEAAFWELGRSGTRSPFLDGTTALLEKAQDPDGYLNSYFQVDHRDRQWAELDNSHEMYCAGHLIQAAVAAARSAPGDAAAQQVVTVARRFADLLVRRYGPDGEDGIDGHPEVETALVELYRITGHRPYLALAARLVELRGHDLLGGGPRRRRYYQDHSPVREATEVTGHVVRQLYLLAGAVDVAVETGDSPLLAAVERLWDSAHDSRTYITGGQGSRHTDEAYGDAYELPPDRAYTETCAAIGSFQLAWRLLLATGHARYADEMERVLLNGLAAGISLDGTAFFYTNPLQIRTGRDGSNEYAPSQRLPWHSCACCPPNLARLMASLHTYTATGDAHGLQLHLYAPGSFRTGDHAVQVDTGYPWDGRITVTVSLASAAPWTLSLRIPAWCTGARLAVNGEPVEATTGYMRLTRTWRPGDRVELTLPMPAKTVTAHPRVDAVRGTVALTRGPLVYCLEHAGLPSALKGLVFEDLYLDPAAVPEVVRDSEAIAPVLLRIGLRSRTGEPATAVPYFLWANRGPGPMRVWIPLANTESEKR